MVRDTRTSRNRRPGLGTSSQKSNSHGILGFGSVAYATGHFLADFSNLITHDWPMVKAWQKASIDNMNKFNEDKITVRTFFKN